ncbi:putative piwil3 protein [Aspergillus bombycis]|uniref:Putative piwil3 protein n=1 Tax=Aspergillus bombycis TaxID=109264 RepID=A0A1F7ZIZ3_9EURO|nr:putative piwil3 protein [Aspergillus bombycis]OGM39414.1 putative piwil3 protein [Aspergillus bombycis]
MSFRGFRDTPQRREGGPTRTQGRSDAKAIIYLPPGGKVPPPDPTVRRIEDGIQKATADPLTLSKLQLNSEYLPRPGYGTKGRPVTLWANYFHITPDPNLVFYRYAIDVRPAASGRKLAQIVRLVLEAPEITSMAADLVTDFKSTIISRVRLPLANNAIIVPVLYRNEQEDEPTEDATQYRARILYTNTLRVMELIEYLTSTNFSQYDEKLPMIQALNILLNHYPKTSPDLVSRGGNRANRSFPLSNKASQSDKARLLGGLIAIRGFFSSVRLAAGRVLVNVNVSHGVFYNSGSLIVFMDTFQKANGKSLPALNEVLHGIRGRTLHLPERRNRSGELIIRSKTVHSLARRGDGTDLPGARRPEIHSFGAGSKGVKFWLEPRQLGSKKKKRQQSGPAASPAGPARLISVYDYFLETYNIRDQRPDLPVINISTRGSPIYLLAQVFEILPGQVHNGKLSPAQTQDMIKFATRFDISTARQLITVEGRILDQPNIMYRGNSTVKQFPGSWNLISTKFNIPGQRLRKWSYLLLSDKEVQETFPDVKSFQPVVNKLQAALLDTGVLVDAPLIGKIIKVDKDKTKDLDNVLQRAAENLDLLYIILPEKDSRWYPVIKRLCDVEYGLQTICSVGSKLVAKKGQTRDQYDKALDQYMRNVAMKFNLKLGGTNHAVDDLRSSIITEDKTMIIGLDVTHPTGSSQGFSVTAPSVAAMVASIDKGLGQWPATIQLQSRGGKEEIDSLDIMLKRHLRLWRLLGKHASFPENIIVFRDGISEGQYMKCLTEELPLLRKACREVYPKEMQEKNLPNFTIIVVSKRHHTRFYPTEVQTADRNGNTPPCTIVDRCITDPHCFSFFLQPHSAIHGTARNAFYFVILDEVFRQRYKRKLPPKYKNIAEVVQVLTLNLSYLVGRATKGVRVCCPARYADLVCDRARCYLSQFYEPASEASSVASGASTMQATNKDVLVNEKIRNTMFYI